MGRSRSATLIIMYLMYKFDVSMKIALQLVKYRRMVVDPNAGFIHQLEKF